MTMKTLVLANQKGGVGKSAIATQFAYYLEARGLRVLVIDLDHQQNTSKPLRVGGKATIAPYSATQLLTASSIDALPELAHDSLVLIPGDDELSTLERQPATHNPILNSLRSQLKRVDQAFDVCILDTNPNPDIRYAAALITAQYVLSPVQLNQEALDGIGSLLNHQRYGYRKIKQAINHTLDLIGILPNLVEPTPFQKANFAKLVESHKQLLIPTQDGAGYAFIPKRSAIAEAQAAGSYIAHIKKSSARDAWKDLEAAFQTIARRMGVKD